MKHELKGTAQQIITQAKTADDSTNVKSLNPRQLLLLRRFAEGPFGVTGSWNVTLAALERRGLIEPDELYLLERLTYAPVYRLTEKGRDVLERDESLGPQG